MTILLPFSYDLGITKYHILILCPAKLLFCEHTVSGEDLTVKQTEHYNFLLILPTCNWPFCGWAEVLVEFKI